MTPIINPSKKNIIIPKGTRIWINNQVSQSMRTITDYPSTYTTKEVIIDLNSNFDRPSNPEYRSILLDGKHYIIAVYNPTAYDDKAYGKVYSWVVELNDTKRST